MTDVTTLQTVALHYQGCTVGVGEGIVPLFHDHQACSAIILTAAAANMSCSQILQTLCGYHIELYVSPVVSPLTTSFKTAFRLVQLYTFVLLQTKRMVPDCGA